jgi:hypothetical protein
VCADLVEIVHGENSYVCVPLLSRVETFRVGCIGAIEANGMPNAVAAIGHQPACVERDWRASGHPDDQAIRSSGPRAAMALASARSGASSVTR